MLKQRHLLALILAIGQAFLYYVRNGVSMVFVAIQCGTDGCGIHHNEHDHLVWTEQVEGYVTGSVYFGYVSGVIFGGFFADKFGTRCILIGIAAINSICTILMPSLLYQTVGWIIGVRVVMGLTTGLLPPCIYSTVARWIPQNERSRTCSFICAGIPAGEALALTAGSNIISHFGWEAALYFPGAVLGVVTILLYLFVFDSPAKHPRISAEEVEYIKANIVVSQFEGKKPNPPYFKILTSGGLWTLIAAHNADATNYKFLYLLGPTYLAHIHKMDFRTEGYALAAISALYVAVSIPFSFLVDKLMESKKLTTTAARKLATGLAALIATAGFLTLGFKGHSSPWISVVSLCAVMVSCGVTTSGYQSIAPDLSPNYSGTLYGISTCVSNMSGFLIPILMARLKMTYDPTTAWSILFKISAANNVLGLIIFTIFGSAEIQPWDKVINSDQGNEAV